MPSGTEKTTRSIFASMVVALPHAALLNNYSSVLVSHLVPNTTNISDLI